MPTIEPFIRWAGGKSWLIPHLQPLYNKIQVNNYHEPFLGGAAVYFAFDYPQEAYLSDSNEELINAYIEIKYRPEEVIRFLSNYENTREDYYRIRSLCAKIPAERAARFIFLNQTSYNGLYRVNRSGDYNVPYGARKKWSINEQKILRASEKLQHATLDCGDFEINRNKIKKNDLVFLDPPYTVSHNENGFIEYNKNLFSLNDQERLCSFIEHIKSKGAYYILTNASHPTIGKIFGKEDQPIPLERRSLIGGKNAARKKVTEFLFTNIRG